LDTNPIDEVNDRIPKSVASRPRRMFEPRDAHQLGERIAGEVAILEEKNDDAIPAVFHQRHAGRLL
jgi:hypothetical protein